MRNLRNPPFPWLPIQPAISALILGGLLSALLTPQGAWGISLNAFSFIYSPLRVKSVEFGKAGPESEVSRFDFAGPFSSFSLRRIQYPKKRGLNWNLSAKLSYNRWDKDILEVEILNIAPAIKGYYHASFGSFSIWGGFGPSFLRGELAEGNEHSKVRISPLYGADYYKFILGRFFGILSIKHQSVPRDTFNTSGFNLESFTTYGAGIGVFFGNTKPDPEPEVKPSKVPLKTPKKLHFQEPTNPEGS